MQLKMEHNKKHEKWIYYDNPKRSKSWVNPGQSVSIPKCNIHESKFCFAFYGTWNAPCIMNCWNQIKQLLLLIALPTINRFKSLLNQKRSVTIQNKNAEWFCCTTMLDHMSQKQLRYIISISMENLTIYRVFTSPCSFGLLLISVQHSFADQTSKHMMK